ECKLFNKACTPESPVGPCMVSSEGACAAYHHFRGIPEPQMEQVRSRKVEQDE
ncbi:MAG: hypothetical protein KAU10_06525, partial [Dehalococcoidia bacterium]|nr:hypothetical protein [Dehalococcoidia bacterium]